MPAFNQDRFDELVLYVAHRTKDDRAFGRTNLAKVLFYSDFSAYRDTGEPLTGAVYVHKEFGPFPRDLSVAEARLVERDLVRLDYDKDEFEDRRIVPVGEPPAMRDFEPWQISLVDIWTTTIQRERTARRVSERSHDHPGWRMSHENEEIPYGAAMLPDAQPTAEQAAEAERVARERGWLANGQWVWERQSA